MQAATGQAARGVQLCVEWLQVGVERHAEAVDSISRRRRRSSGRIDSPRAASPRAGRGGPDGASAANAARVDPRAAASSSGSSPSKYLSRITRRWGSGRSWRARRRTSRSIAAVNTRVASSSLSVSAASRSPSSSRSLARTPAGMDRARRRAWSTTALAATRWRNPPNGRVSEVVATDDAERPLERRRGRAPRRPSDRRRGGRCSRRSGADRSRRARRTRRDPTRAAATRARSRVGSMRLPRSSIAIGARERSGGRAAPAIAQRYCRECSRNGHPRQPSALDRGCAGRGSLTIVS